MNDSATSKDASPDKPRHRSISVCYLAKIPCELELRVGCFKIQFSVVGVRFWAS